MTTRRKPAAVPEPFASEYAKRTGAIVERVPLKTPRPRRSRTVSETALHTLLVAVHYSASFDGGPLPIEEANPTILKAARDLALIDVVNFGSDDAPSESLGLTERGEAMVEAALQAAGVDAEDSEALAEWAQSVSPRVKDFESRVDTWSKLELHALESMINELRR